MLSNIIIRIKFYLLILRNIFDFSSDNKNKAIIFNSNLFHEIDKIDFKEGYNNRRINLTILFENRE